MITDYWYVDCDSCGKQVLIESQKDRCYWCHKPAVDKTKPLSFTLPPQGRKEPAYYWYGKNRSDI